MIRAMRSRVVGHALVMLLIAGCADASSVGAADRWPDVDLFDRYR